MQGQSATRQQVRDKSQAADTKWQSEHEKREYTSENSPPLTCCSRRLTVGAQAVYSPVASQVVSPFVSMKTCAQTGRVTGFRRKRQSFARRREVDCMQDWMVKRSEKRSKDPSLGGNQSIVCQSDIFFCRRCNRLISLSEATHETRLCR